MDTRELIIKESYKLFLLKGYKEVSLKDIVEKVGLTKGAFYHHFKSKDQLFLEIADGLLVESQNKIYHSLPTDSLKTFLNLYLERVVSYIDYFKSILIVDGESTQGIAFFNIMFDALKLVPGFDKKMRDVHTFERELWCKVVSNARKNGEISSNMSDMQIARLFISITDGIGLHMILEGRMDDVPAEIFSLMVGLYNHIKS